MRDALSDLWGLDDLRDDIVEQYRAGVLTYDDACFEMRQLGYSLEDATARLDWAG